MKYPDCYNEALSKATDLLNTVSGLSPKEEFHMILLFLVEYSQMWYKVKCLAGDIERCTDIANGYAEGVQRLKARLTELFENGGNE